jgi:hypothetical protein
MPVIPHPRRVYTGRFRGELQFAVKLLGRIQAFSNKHPTSGVPAPPLQIAQYNEVSTVIGLFAAMLAQTH